MIRIILFLSLCASAFAADWPTYRGDNRRSGTAQESLTLPLKQLWHHQGGAPQQAWAGPAKWDAYSANSGLQSMRNFDPCHYVTTSNHRLYYGSSNDNGVHCIDLRTGKELWVFFTNGAVRLPPSITNNKAYFGSDDGFAYCIDAIKGTLIWKVHGAPEQRLVPSDGKLISTHPIRTGVTLIDDKAVFAASLVPWAESYLWCVDQNTGTIENGGYTMHSDNVTLQGAMLYGGDLLYLPQGRAACLKYDAKTGQAKGNIGHSGGVVCLLTEDNQFVSGPKNQKAKEDQMLLTDKQGKKLASFNNTNRVVVDGHLAFMHTNGKMSALDQSVDEKSPERWKWQIEQPAPTDLILAGDLLIIGLHHEVRVLNKLTGQQLWAAKVDGEVHGLAVSNGQLMISTNKGHIYAFAE